LKYKIELNCKQKRNYDQERT